MIKTYLDLFPSDENNQFFWNPDNVLSMKALEALYQPFELHVEYMPEFDDSTDHYSVDIIKESLGIVEGMHVGVYLKSFSLNVENNEQSIDFLRYQHVKNEKPVTERCFFGNVAHVEVVFPHDQGSDDRQFYVELKIVSVLNTLKERTAFITYRDHMVSDLFKSSLNIAGIDKLIDCSSLMEIELGDGQKEIVDKKDEIKESLGDINQKIEAKKSKTDELKAKVMEAKGKLGNQQAVDDSETNRNKSQHIKKSQDTLKAYITKIGENTPVETDLKLREAALKKIKESKDLLESSYQLLQSVCPEEEKVKAGISKNLTTLKNKRVEINDMLWKLDTDISDVEKGQVIDKFNSTVATVITTLQTYVNELEVVYQHYKGKVNTTLSKEAQAYNKLSAEKEDVDREFKDLKAQAAQASSDLSARIPKDSPIFHYTEFVIPGTSLWDTNQFICSETKTIFISDWEKSKVNDKKKETISLFQGGYLRYPFYGATLNVGSLSDNEFDFKMLSHRQSGGDLASKFYEDEQDGAPIDYTLKGEGDEYEKSPQFNARDDEIVIEHSYGHQNILSEPNHIKPAKTIVGLAKRCDLFPGVKVAMVNTRVSESEYNFCIVKKVEHFYANKRGQKYHYDALVTLALLDKKQESESEPDPLLPVPFKHPKDFYNQLFEMVVLSPTKEIDQLGGIIQQDQNKNNRVLLVFPHVYYSLIKKPDLLSSIITNYAIWAKQIQPMAAANLGIKTVPSSGARAVVGFKNSKPYLPIILGYNFTPRSVAETTDKSKDVDNSIFSVYLGQSHISMSTKKTKSKD